jgi:hypothetical protein
VTVSQYRNGSDVSQSNLVAPLTFHEAADIEANAALGIGTYWPGDWSLAAATADSNPQARLPGDLDATSTTVLVTGTGSVRPPKAPATWPYLDSRGTGLQLGAYSQDTYNFVSWVRIDNEILKVIAAPTVDGLGNVTLSVERGMFGTTSAVHSAGTRVLSPVYVGNKNSGISDQNFNGTPLRANTRFPLRYGIKIWDPVGYGWIVNRITTLFGPNMQGYNTIWSDVSSCQMYNYASAYGDQLAPWNDPATTKMTVTAWGAHQLDKLAGLRAAFPTMKFIANNFRTRPSPSIDPCNTQIIQQGFWDGVDIENFLKGLPNTTDDWTTEMPQNFQIQLNNWPATYWTRFSRGGVTVPPDQHLRLAYGSLLLAYESTATAFQFGGVFGLTKPNNLLLWNWGAPHGNPTSVGDDAVAGTPLYKRSFDNGIVLVNPSAASYTYNLGATYYDVVNLDTAGNPSPTTSVTIASGDASFLLYSVT